MKKTNEKVCDLKRAIRGWEGWQGIDTLLKVEKTIDKSSTQIVDCR